MKLLLYCTKEKLNLYMLCLPFEHDCFEEDEASRFYLAKEPVIEIDTQLNGKIVAECECDNIELFTTDYRRNEEQLERICKESCLIIDELISYEKSGNQDYLYAPHLKNIRVFDEPKELNNYFKSIPLSYEDWLYGIYNGKRGSRGSYNSYINIFPLNKAPQNMCRCYDKDGNEYILISIRPRWLCKILNGKKTIEVRKKILNEMKELIKDDYN